MQAALMWWLKAADQGYAQYNLGAVFAMASMGKVYEEAVCWFSEAAAQDGADAQACQNTMRGRELIRSLDTLQFLLWFSMEADPAALGSLPDCPVVGRSCYIAAILPSTSSQSP